MVSVPWVSDQVSGPVRHGGFRPLDAEPRAPISAVPRSANARSASRTAAVSSPRLRFAGPGGFAIRSADDPDEEQLPLDGADRENREAAVVGELAEPVGEVALPLPAQPRDPMRRDRVEEAFRNIEAPEVLEAVQQPVGVCGIAARLELPEPDEPASRRRRPSLRADARGRTEARAGLVRVRRQASALRASCASRARRSLRPETGGPWRAS